MLKKIYRVTKDKEFQAIYRRGQFQSTALFSIHYLRSKRDVSRIGIVVSKKITKKAVERNLIKRRIREITKEIHKNLNNNYDVVISVKKPVLETSFEEQKRTLEEMFKKARLLT